MSRRWPERELREPRPYAVADLAQAVGIDPRHTTRLAMRLGISRRWVRRLRPLGLTARQADDWAARVGLHPLNIWPHWGDDIPDPCCDSYECTCDTLEAM